MEMNGNMDRNARLFMDVDYKPSFVITGQQVGLLGGPLYTLYKILTAIRLAEKHQVSPVFWMELNDSDFNEINKLTVQKSDGELETLEWKKQTAGMSVGYVEADDQLRTILNQYLELLPDNEITRKLKKRIPEIYQSGRELQDIAVDLFRLILQDFQVEFFNPMSPDFIQFSQPILRNECLRTEVGQQCNAFMLHNKKRVAIFRTKSGFKDRHGEEIDPGKSILLPNFRTRPLLQDAWFKNAIYVAGPSEGIYLSQLEDLYRYHRVQQSRIVPRFSTTILPDELHLELNQSGIAVPDLMDCDRSEVFNRFLLSREGETPASLKHKAERVRLTFINELRKLGMTAKNLDYQTKKLLKNETGAFRAAMKQKYAKEIQLIYRASNFLKPYGQPQERVFPILGMMAMLGNSNFVNHIYQHIETPSNLLEISYA